MIRVDEGAQQWIVTLRNVDGEPVEVRVDMTVPIDRWFGSLDDPRIGMYAHSNDSKLLANGSRVYEQWPMIIEKAYAALSSAEDDHAAWVTLHNPHGHTHLVQMPIDALVAKKGEHPLFKHIVVGSNSDVVDLQG